MTDTGPLPLPLPVPPGVGLGLGRDVGYGHGQAVSYQQRVSETRGRERAKSFVDDDGESETTMKRRRSIGPPRTPFSASGLNLILDLPDGPRMWTPEDMAGAL